jgi:hypothetical protein
VKDPWQKNGESLPVLLRAGYPMRILAGLSLPIVFRNRRSEPDLLFPRNNRRPVPGIISATLSVAQQSG